MANPDFFGEPQTPRLGALLNEIRTGQLQVPRFQRPFVWDDEQRLALLDSIYHGYPIGSILIWRTQQHRTATYEKLGPARLPPTDGTLVHQYILDGHQRLATLYASLGPGLEPDESKRDAWRQMFEEEEETDWPIYFVLDEDGSGRSPFQLLPRGGVPATWLPLDILFDSYQLSEFKDRLRQGGRSRQLVNRVQSVADTFRDYTVPVIPIVAEALDQVTTSFKRVNSGGTPMGEVHMLNALTWTEDFDLLQRMGDISLSLDDTGWSKLDPQALINVCKVLMGLDIYKADMEEVGKRLRSEPTLLDRAVLAIRRAAAVLDRIASVRGPAVLPYVYQIVLLAVILPPHDEELTPSQERDLGQWFWATTLSEYFTGMTNSLFNRARGHLQRVLRGESSPRPDDAQPRVEALRTFDFRGSRSRAMALLMAGLLPQDPLHNQSDPFDLLAKHGKDCLVRIVSSEEVPPRLRALTAGPANRFLLHPRSARELRQQLRGLHGDLLAQGHAITPEALSKLRDGDPGAFLELRSDRLNALERAKRAELGW